MLVDYEIRVEDKVVVVDGCNCGDECIVIVWKGRSCWNSIYLCISFFCNYYQVCGIPYHTLGVNSYRDLRGLVVGHFLCPLQIACVASALTNFTCDLYDALYDLPVPSTLVLRVVCVEASHQLMAGCLLIM